VTILTSPKHQESWKGKWELYESIEGFPHYRTKMKNSLQIGGYKEYRLISSLNRRIREVIRIINPDIIHAHSPVLNAIPAFRAGKKFGIPVVYEIRAFWEDAAVDHNTYKENSLKYRTVRTLETWACRRADMVTVICKGLYADLIERGIPSSKLAIIPNGFNDKDFKESLPDEKMAAKWNLEGKKIIGFLGSFYKYEGLDLLIDAFVSLAQQYKDCVLLLVGGGEMEKILKKKSQDLGMTNRIIIPGRIPHDQIPSIYALTDILVYPRYSMRLTEIVTPLKPLEAMAMGKAVIASRVGGHQELIKYGETGMLFTAGDTTALTSAMEQLLIDDNLRINLASNAKNWVHKERTWDKTTSTYEDIYNKALSLS
jgi:PEP-CTERM/exosortase A-associated glycosyltransferase